MYMNYSFYSSFCNIHRLDSIKITEDWAIVSIINKFLSLNSAMGINESWFMEWFWLVKSISVLSSDNICVCIVLSGP